MSEPQAAIMQHNDLLQVFRSLDRINGLSQTVLMLRARRMTWETAWARYMARKASRP